MSRETLFRRLSLVVLAAGAVLWLTRWTPATAADEPGPITVQELHAIQKSETPWLVVDVRTPEEYRQGHVPGVVSMPLSTIAARSKELEKLARGREVAVICRSGRRSARAIQLLRAEKTTLVLHNVEGGTLAWQRAGLPLEKP